MKALIDLRLLGNLKEEDLLRFAEECWCLGLHNNMEVVITKRQSIDLIRIEAEYLNAGKPIHDGRTKGGKFFKNMTENNSKSLNIYETDYGTITLIINNEI